MRLCAAAILAAGGCFVSSVGWAQSAGPAAIVSEPGTNAPAVTPLPAVTVEATTQPKKSAAKKKAVKNQSSATGTPSAQKQKAEPAKNYRGAPGTATGPVENYVAQNSETGTKTDTPLKETPQSISVIGAEQMRDQGVQNLQESIRYVPGVVADGFGYDSRGDFSLIRGTEAAYYVDGLRTNYGYFVNTSAIEPYSLQRVEVLRGPSSMLYGQAPVGGIINTVSKLPSDIAYNEITLEYGSFDFKQVKFDSTGALTSDGKWLYRVVGLGRDADTQVDYVENDRLMLAPSLTYRPTNDTSITLLGNFRDDHSGSTQQFLPQIGTLTPNVNGQIVPRSTFTGEPTDFYDTESQSGTVFIDHKLAEGIKMHHASRYTHTENSYESHYAVVLTPARLGFLGLPISTAPFLDADQTQIARAYTKQFSETEVFNSDTNVAGTFMTGDAGHKLIGGFDYMRYETDQLTAGTLLDNISPYGQPVFDIYNPQYGKSSFYYAFDFSMIPKGAVPLYWRPEEVQKQSGLYIQDQIKWGSWIAVLGMRQDWLTMEQEGSPDETETATTGRAALMYESNLGLTPYISYSTSFSPQPGQPVGNSIRSTVLGETLKPAGPLEGEQVEVGLKYQPDKLPFMVSAALYQLNDRNRIVQPDVLFDAVQGADVKVKGFEIEAVGALTREMKVIAAYSYTDATYEKYPELYPLASGISDYMVGKQVEWIPKHLASLWAIYTFHSGALNGLSLGGGVRYVGSTVSIGKDIATGAELNVITPSYTLFDAMVSYETPDWRWQLTAQNLEDEYYVTTCSAYRGDCGVGQARTIISGFTYKF